MAIGTVPRRRGGGLFDVKPTDAIVADTEENGRSLRRAVGALDLTALGIGAIIGTGIFVIIGEAIGKSGPAIIISFVLAGVTCLFSALSYAELAAMIPVSGSAYTNSYATLGELVAWIIGWDLILEYGFSVAVVAVGWGGYQTRCSATSSVGRCPTPSPARPARAAWSTCRRCSWSC
jgi:basic amino acid/polyamine antiporter, APA family